MHLRSSYILFLLGLCAFPGEALAQEGLYQAPPPEDAAFVRFVGFDAHDQVRWHDLTFAAQDTSVLEDYFVVHSSDIGVERGAMITIIPNQAGTPIEIVEPEKSADKVALGLLNLGEATASLRTADGKVEIVGATNQLDASFREVNPISVSVAVFSEGGAIGEPISLALRRGQPVTIVLSTSGDIHAVESKIIPGVVE